MTDHSSIRMLTCVGLAAIASACSTPSEQQSVQKVDLPPGAIGRIDTQTTRTLPYTLRENDNSTTLDTKFNVLFGSGTVGVPLEPFYGADAAGQTGTWPVDGSGRATKTPGTGTPGFINRLESMPNGPIQIGQTWETIVPSDSQAMASSEVILQQKRRWTVVQAFSTSTGPAVRGAGAGWTRIFANSAMAHLAHQGMFNPQPDWGASLKGTVDVELNSGTLLGMRYFEDLLGDTANPDDLIGTSGSMTYCIDTTSGYQAAGDICGWNQ